MGASVTRINWRQLTSEVITDQQWESNVNQSYQRGGDGSRLARLEERMSKVETELGGVKSEVGNVKSWIDKATARQSVLLMLMQPVTAVIVGTITALVIAYFTRAQ